MHIRGALVVPDFNPDGCLNDAPLVDTAEARRLHDQLLASKPEGASHNPDICQFCVDKATEDASTASRNPPADGGPDVSETQPVPDEHGGRDTHPMSDMISKETHEALLAKAVADATSATEKALETKTAEAKDFAAKAEKLEADNAGLKADNEKVTQLESDIAKKDEAAAKAEIASKRAEQVKNLKLYDDQYVAERASAWAELTDEAWDQRLDEWSKLKPATDASQNTDAASAMSGTSGDLTKEPASTDTAGDQSTKKSSARRAVLGLV
jgi:hypothetical protein